MSISNQRMLESLDYKVNDRTLGELRRLFSPDYQKLCFDYQDRDIVYSGAEHSGKPKLPNITFLPNLHAREDIVLASTFGHQHTQWMKRDTRDFQEVYEFHGYGAMLLRNLARTALYVLKPGDKVVASPIDSMAIFSLQQEPLLTLDYANPEKNSASKDLEKKIGTFMLVTQDRQGISFKFNPAYFQEELLKGEPAEIRINDIELGEPLYHRIKLYMEEFKRTGIGIFFGGNIPEELQGEFSPSLLELVMKRNKTLLDMLEMT